MSWSEPVTAVLLSFNRPEALDFALTRVEELPFEEIIVADNSSTSACVDVARRHGDRVRVFDLDDLGVAGLNVAVRAARTEHVVLLDDDSFPRPGAVERLLGAFRRVPVAAVVGGEVHEVDMAGVERVLDVDIFNFFLSRGRPTDDPAGIEAFFFPQGGCMVRRSAFLEVGGFFEPGFFTVSELDLATRLIGAGWDVRFVRGARFDHLRTSEGRTPQTRYLRYFARNEIWYFWVNFPGWLAARRIVAYGLLNLIHSSYRGGAAAWWAGIGDAWSQRGRVRHLRRPLSRAALRRAELDRGRLQLRLLGRLARIWPSAAVSLSSGAVILP
jgi:GT2 family glycosyltransferase